MNNKKTRLAILVSGSGTNCENIINYFHDSDSVETAVVISNRSDAYALQRAKNHSVPTAIITRQEFTDNPSQVLEAVSGCDYIILAGFLVRIPQYLIDAFPRRIINIHPRSSPNTAARECTATTSTKPSRQRERQRLESPYTTSTPTSTQANT